MKPHRDRPNWIAPEASSLQNTFFGNDSLCWTDAVCRPAFRLPSPRTRSPMTLSMTTQIGTKFVTQGVPTKAALYLES